MRNPKRYLTKLQKISQTSSPQKQKANTNLNPSVQNRINPASLTSSYLKFKRYEQERERQSILSSSVAESQSQFQAAKSETIDQKNKRINQLQQQIINKKIQLNTLQKCFEKRISESTSKTFKETFNQGLNSVIRMHENTSQGQEDYLQIIFQYSKQRPENPNKAFKNVVEWNLNIVRSVFNLMSKLMRALVKNKDEQGL